MSGIGGHVNRADRARRRDQDLDQPDPWRWTDAEAVAAFAEALGLPLDPWQRVILEAYLDDGTVITGRQSGRRRALAELLTAQGVAVTVPRRSGRTITHRPSWHAPGVAYDIPAPRDD